MKSHEEHTGTGGRFFWDLKTLQVAGDDLSEGPGRGSFLVRLTNPDSYIGHWNNLFLRLTIGSSRYKAASYIPEVGEATPSVDHLI